jgi:hypothetical protein
VVAVVVVGMAAQGAQQLFHLGDQSARVLVDLAEAIMLQVMQQLQRIRPQRLMVLDLLPTNLPLHQQVHA